ncbi:putative LNK family protein [Helianthus anomalus]
MSDLSIYELEDIIWDDFEHSGDHIVPHPTDDQGSEDKCDGDVCKKPRLDVTPLQSNEERVFKTSNKETNIMEKDTWSNMLDDVFAASGDAGSAKDMPTVQSDDGKLSNNCFESSNINSGSGLSTDEGILKDSSGAVDRNSYNDLNLFSNEYGWPDAGYFEDMDRMLSNCDSSFGLGVTGNDDELVWFTSDDPTRGLDDTLKMDLKLPCSEPSALTNISQDHEHRESDNKMKISLRMSKDELKDEDQKEQSRQQALTEGLTSGHGLGKFGLKSTDMRTSSSGTFDKNITSMDNWQQNRNLGHDSVDYMQRSGYLHLGHDHVSMPSPGGSMMTQIKSESKASGQVLSMESSSQPLYTGYQNQDQSGMILQGSENDMSQSKKQFHMIENKIEFQGDMEGTQKGASSELNSSLSTELDEISLEATTFRQLQQAMLQLDLRTKLCIRDSLYRLARSAEQRHNYAGINDGTGTPLVTEGASKYTGYMDMETDTNPIDRTVAHLLFHRPSDSSNMPTSLPLKPNVKVHGSKTGPAVVTKKPSCQQAENESDDKISSTQKN